MKTILIVGTTKESLTPMQLAKIEAKFKDCAIEYIPNPIVLNNMGYSADILVVDDFIKPVPFKPQPIFDTDVIYTDKHIKSHHNDKPWYARFDKKKRKRR